MSTEKLSRKEVREPDPFAKAINELWQKVLANQKILGIGLGVIFVAFIVASVVSRSGQSRATEAGSALAKAMDLARRGVEGSTELAQDADAPKFKTYKEKNEALAAKLEEVRSKYPGTESALTATALLGDAQFHLGKLDEAGKAYADYLAAAPQGDALRTLALEGQGYVYEAKKEWDRALQAFEEMSKSAAGEPNKARAAYHRARVLEESGKKQEAATAFQKLKDEFKEASAAREAADRLSLLAAQGFVPEKSAEKPPEKPPEKKDEKK